MEITSSSNNWRVTSSEKLLELIQPHLPLFGISRTANLTGLDLTGIPIYTSIRPRASTLTVSCGKGITHTDSIVSSIMESIEIDVAECLPAEFYFNSTYDQLPAEYCLDLSQLPVLLNSVFSTSVPYSWLLCNSLNTSRNVYLPAATVSLTHSSIIDPLMTFVWGTNGLASGFSREDAILSGLYEYIERDALISWQQLISAKLLKEALVDLDTVPFSSTQILVNLIQRQSLRLYLFDRTSDLGLPVYRAVIHSPLEPTISFAEGFGCHHLDEVAINRAITEAAQSRTVTIAGARDDISYKKLLELSKQSLPDNLSSVIPFENFNPTDLSFATSSEALLDIQSRLERLGFNDVFVYDFPVANKIVSVVRVFVPGLQHYSHRYNVPSSRLIPFTPRLQGLRETLYNIKNGF